MADTAPHNDTAPASIEAAFDTPSRQGWEFFTKFLLWNVIVIGVALIGVGLLTVWR